MSAFITDSFIDAPGTSLDSHTPDQGGPATKVTSVTGSAQITSANRLRAATAATQICYQYAGTPAAADYDVLCDVYIASITTDAAGTGPLARIQPGAQTYYWAYLVNDPQRSGGGFAGYELYKTIAGTQSLIAQSAPVTLSTGQTIKLKLSVRSSTISLYTSSDGGVTFTPACSGTESSITAAGEAGIAFYAQSAITDTTGIHADNLSGVSNITVFPDDPAWFSSPGNWIVNSSAAISTDFGAKRCIVVSGTSSASLTFDLSALTAAAIASADYPQIRYSIDGGITTDAAITANLSLFTALSTGAHEIVYEFVRGNSTIDSYTTPVMAVRETGLILAVGATVSAPADLQPDRMFVTGDSITQGLAMLSTANPAGDDATATFAKALGPALGAEVGVAGKAGVGWIFAGGANVPVFTTEWKNAWTSQPRSFPNLKRIVAVVGTNDGLNNLSDSGVTAAVISWLADARATLGAATWLHVVIPFGGFKRSAILAGVSAYKTAHPTDFADALDLGSTLQTGLAGPSNTPTRPAPSDGIHPGIISHGQLGAALAVAIKTAETTSSIGRLTNTVGGGLLAGL